MTFRDFVKKNKPTLIYFLSIVFTLTLSNTQTTYYLKTISSFIKYFLYFNYKPIYEIVDYPIATANKFIYLSYMYEENLKLKQKIKKDFLKNLKIQEFLTQKFQQEEINNIKKNLKYKFLDCKVILRDYQSWYDFVIVSINDNYKEVKEDMPVILNEDIDKFYFIGRIWSIENNKAKILLITNPLSAVPVKIKNKNIEGIIIGSSYANLILDYILPDDDIKIGDIVVTSELNNIPENIEIGKVIKIETSTTKIFKRAIVKPSFNINVLKNLLIILNIRE
ncbi:MAG: rod shape-determining protein MreC [Endomicrobiia bacterium]